MHRRRNRTIERNPAVEAEARAAAIAAVNAAASGDDPLRALVINLESARDRMGAISSHLNEVGVGFERVPGVKGSELSSYATRKLAPNWGRAMRGEDRAGTLGCFLAHVSAWERVANGDGGFYLVLEDDARPLGPMPRSFASLNIPDDVDLCFCNLRMEPMFADGNFPTRPIIMSTLETRRTRPLTQRAHGGDAYFLSKQGADKLLAAVDVVGPITHVDWFLLVAGIDEDAARGLRPDDHTLDFYNRKREKLRPMRHIRFNMMSLWPALMTRTGGIESTRRAENEA